MIKTTLIIESTDSNFMCNLIDYLNKAEVEPNTTTVTACTPEEYMENKNA